MAKENKIVVFQNKKIRRKWYSDEWWFAIKDVVLVLTDSKDPSQYLKRLRSRDDALNDVFKGGYNLYPPLA